MGINEARKSFCFSFRAGRLGIIPVEAMAVGTL